MNSSTAVTASIIVPVHNGCAYLRYFWPSLLSNLDETMEVIVVDDGSTEPIGETIPAEVEHRSKRLLLVRNEFAEGYASAVNLGASLAKGTHLVLLNTDLILGSDSLKSLLHFAETKKRVGVVGSKLIYPQDDTLQHVGVCFDSTLKIHFFAGSKADSRIAQKLREVQAATFAQVCVPRKVWLELNGLDTAYFNRNEDIDFCLRVREKGYRVFVNPASCSYHWESLSGIPRFSLSPENEARFWGRWAKKLEVDVASYIKEAWDSFQIPDLSSSVRILNLSRGLIDQPIINFIMSRYPKATIEQRRQTSTDNRVHYLPMLFLPRVLECEVPYIYIADRVSMLERNTYWFQRRLEKVGEEIVIDHRLRVETTEKLVG